MSGGTEVPKFHNHTGVREIRIGVREFECMGALPPHDHPHIFLDMGEERDIVCPYCSTLYRFDEALDAGHAVPEEAIWRQAV